jgi:hypothetical protein
MKDSLYTLFLAQIMGLYMVIMPIILIQRRELYRNLLRGVDKPNLALMTGASIGLILGLILVDVHNIWVWKPQIVITLVSWLVLIKSILWLSMPERMLTLCKKMSKSPWLYVQLAITGLVGIFLLAKGFFLFTPPYFPFNGVNF